MSPDPHGSGRPGPSRRPPARRRDGHVSTAPGATAAQPGHKRPAAHRERAGAATAAPAPPPAAPAAPTSTVGARAPLNRREDRIVRFTRVWLPLIIIAAGVAIGVLYNRRNVGLEIAGMMVGAGISVWLLNVLHRMGVDGDRDRAREERARRYYAEHGHWPDERRSRPS